MLALYIGKLAILIGFLAKVRRLLAKLLSFLVKVMQKLVKLEIAGSQHRKDSQTGWIASQTFAILSQSIAEASQT